MGLILMLSGCAHYHLGVSQEVSFKTLHIDLVENRSFAPQAQALLTRNLIVEFLLDNSVKLVEADEADATLQVTLTEYKRNSVANQSTDTSLARSFDLSLKADITLTNNKSGSAFIQSRSIATKETAYVLDQSGAETDGFLQTEYKTLPILTRSLAKEIRNAVVDVW